MGTCSGGRCGLFYFNLPYTVSCGKPPSVFPWLFIENVVETQRAEATEHENILHQDVN